MDKMREEFEVWWISKNPNHTDVKSYWHETGYWVNSNSAYSNLDFAWECWKASRAALCVELPDNLNGEYYADGWNACLECVEGKLEGVEVSHK